MDWAVTLFKCDSTEVRMLGPPISNIQALIVLGAILYLTNKFGPEGDRRRLGYRGRPGNSDYTAQTTFGLSAIYRYGGQITVGLHFATLLWWDSSYTSRLFAWLMLQPTGFEDFLLIIPAIASHH